MKHRSLVLPFAILVGFFFHQYLSLCKPAVPFLIFFILFFNFSALDIHKMRVTGLHWIILAFQVVFSLLSYLLIRGANEVIAQGVMLGILCPVAASVVVVACMLGANRETITTYTLVGNAGIAIAAPIYFSFIGTHVDMPFFQSFALILSKIFPIIVLPLILIILLQKIAPKINSAVSSIKGISFYLWAVALMITISQTINFIFLNGAENKMVIVVLSLASIFCCAIQFAFGRWVGRRYGDAVAGGQALGQKNTALGIWLATIYLNPLASIFPATYSIWQNLFNSWQLWQHDRKRGG